ncbi:hypothetical protein [Bradyrhizobium diazoefficiens]
MKIAGFWSVGQRAVSTWEFAMHSSATRPALPPGTVSKTNRSKVTNGKRLFADMTVDGRSGWSRRLRDLLQLHIADLGGEDVVSAAEHSICRRIAAITTELELLERRFALKGKGASEKDLDLYFRGAGVLRRLLESIGLKRVARDVTPLLQDYLAANHPATVTTDEDDGE